MISILSKIIVIVIFAIIEHIMRDKMETPEIKTRVAIHSLTVWQQHVFNVNFYFSLGVTLSFMHDTFIQSDMHCKSRYIVIYNNNKREYGDSGQISTWKFQHFSILNFKTKISHYLTYAIHTLTVWQQLSHFSCVEFLGETLTLKHIYALCILQFYHCIQSLHFINASCS